MAKKSKKQKHRGGAGKKWSAKRKREHKRWLAQKKAEMALTHRYDKRKSASTKGKRLAGLARYYRTAAGKRTLKKMNPGLQTFWHKYLARHK